MFGQRLHDAIQPANRDLDNQDGLPDARFAGVLREELAGLRPDIDLRAATTLKQLQATIDQADMAALCLSGGGIRSAAFALGVMQALARFGLLEKFDYLSTVSGGGYIGSFLTAWRHQAGDLSAIAGLDRSRHESGAEAPEIAGLRANSNYLTPKLGVLSADSWTAAALIIRNLVLNWLIFVPFFMGVLFVPRLCMDLLNAVPGWAGWPCLVGGVAASIVGLTFASYGRRRAAGLWLTDGRFLRLVLGPIVVASMLFTAATAALTSTAATAAPLSLHNSWWLIGGSVAGGICYAMAWLLASAFRPGPPVQGQSKHPRSESWPADLFAWIVAGMLAGLVLTQGMRLSLELPPERLTKWLTVLGISWTMLSIFAGELIYIGLRSYSARGDMDREWLARAAGWLTAGAATWSMTTAVALFGPNALTTGMTFAIASMGVGGMSGLVALGLGGSARTAATTATKLASRMSLSQIVSLAGLVFALFLAILVSLLNGYLIFLIQPVVMLKPAALGPAVLDGICTVALIALSVVISVFVNVNRFSLHAVYRNRLVRAFLGSARRCAEPPRDPDPFTGFDPADNPRMRDMPRDRLLHVVNIALNVVSTKNLAWQERKAESFTVSPLHAGNPLVGYRPTEDFGGGGGGITLGTAMAISGAAVSPNMGYHSSPLLGFLLMLFNVRLGWWLGNPAGNEYRREGPRFGIVTLLQELANQTTAEGPWIYLSDGGHFDNLGLYEMVRRRCRFIVISDAGCDPDAALADLGNAVRKVGIDFGVRIRFDRLDVAARTQPPQVGVYCWVGRILYPGSEVEGWLLYVKPAYHGNEAPDIRSYAAVNALFPHESTSEQWFGESQFEAYRALGAHQMELICSGGEDLSRTSPKPLGLDDFRQRAERYLLPDADLGDQIESSLGPTLS